MAFTQDEWPGGQEPGPHAGYLAAQCSPTFPATTSGLNYDPSHMIWQHMDYLKPMRDFTDKLFHVHAKDVRLDKHRLDEVGIMATPLEFHVPKLPGLGDIDWGQFFSVLSDVGYDGPVCIEVEDRALRGLAREPQSLACAERALSQELHAVASVDSRPDSGQGQLVTLESEIR